MTKEQEDAIIEACTYSKEKMSHTYNRVNGISRFLTRPFFEPGRNPDPALDFEALMRAQFRAAPSQLGTLDKMPLELLYQIFLDLDLQSLMCLRQTSLKGRYCVDSSKEFQLILKIALLPLQAMKRDGYTSLFTLRNYYRLLCEWKCGFCKNFAEYIHMPLQVRCCVECLRQGWIDLAMTDVKDLEPIACFTNSEINALTRDGTPWVINNPQGFSWNSKWRRNESKITTYTVREAVAAWESENPGQRMNKSILTLWYYYSVFNGIYHLLTCCAFPSYDTKLNTTRLGYCCAGCSPVDNNFNWRVLINGPICYKRVWLSTDSEFKPESWPQDDRFRVWSREQFLVHFEDCTDAQAVWAECVKKESKIMCTVKMRVME
jgi:hypothetical protein